MLICFIGIDGSGKTTLTKAVIDELNQNSNLKFKYVHAAVSGFFLEPFMSLGRLLFAKKIDGGKNYSEFSKAKKDGLAKHRYLFKPYEFLVMFDYLPQLFIKIVQPLKNGINLITDRYVFDTAINTGFNLNYSAEQVAGIIWKYFRFVPESDLIFLIDLPEEIAFQRKDDIPAIEYLKERRRYYKELSEIFNMIVLNGKRSVTELKEYAVDIINKKIEANINIERLNE